MKKKLLLVLIIIVLVLFQTSFLPEFFGKHAVPNLVLSLCFALLILDKLDDSLFVALFGGVFIDFILNKPVGLSSVVLSVLLSVAYLAKKYVFKGLSYYVVLCVLSSYIYISIIFNGTNLFDIHVFTGSLICSVVAVILLEIYKKLFPYTKY